jgi:hypothetical protein
MSRVPEKLLPLIGRDRVLANKLARTLAKEVNHTGPFETLRGNSFEVQITNDKDVPTGHIFDVRIELLRIEQ